MIISVDVDKVSGLQLSASFEEYDGNPPGSRFLIGYKPANIRSEFLALAGYLVFGSWASGRIQFTENISAELASAIEDDSYPVRVRPQGIGLVPKKVVTGSGDVHLNTTWQSLPPGHRSISVVLGGINDGSIRKSENLEFSSNAFIFASCVDDEFRARPYIAAALLATTDLETLHLYGNVDLSEYKRLQHLLRAVGVRVLLVGDR